jgi:hypothetical protein
MMVTPCDLGKFLYSRTEDHPGNTPVTRKCVPDRDGALRDRLNRKKRPTQGGKMAQNGGEGIFYGGRWEAGQRDKSPNGLSGHKGRFELTVNPWKTKVIV